VAETIGTGLIVFVGPMIADRVAVSRGGEGASGLFSTPPDQD